MTSTVGYGCGNTNGRHVADVPMSLTHCGGHRNAVASTVGYGCGNTNGWHVVDVPIFTHRGAYVATSSEHIITPLHAITLCQPTILVIIIHLLVVLTLADNIAYHRITM